MTEATALAMRLFLVKHVKHEVYSNNPYTEDDLRHGMQDFTSSSTYNEYFCYFWGVSAIQRWKFPAPAINMPCSTLNYKVSTPTQGNLEQGWEVNYDMIHMK